MKARRGKPRRMGTLEKAWRWMWRFRLAPAGKVMLVGIMLSGMTCWITLNIPIYHVFSSLVAAYLTSSLFVMLMRRRLSVRAQMPDRAIAGHEVTATFQLTNRSRRSAFDLGAGFFQLPPCVRQMDDGPVVPRLGPGESATLEVRLHPLRRGLHPLGDAHAYSTFPFNFSRNWPVRCPGQSLLVLPDFQPLADVDLPVGSRYQPGGIALTSNVGESPEYIGSRDYRPGDSTRRLDFRSWARLAHPVVREYQEEYYCRVGLVLDTFVPGRRKAPPGGFEDLEAAVSLTAAAAEALSRGEYIIDLFAAGPELYVFRAGRHTAHFENVLEILACVEACRDNPFDTVSPALADELESISAVVFVLLDWDATRRRVVRAAAEAGCSARAIIVRRRPTTEPIDAGGAWADSIRVLSPEQIRTGALEVL